MGYLNNQVVTVDAILTKKGREKDAKIKRRLAGVRKTRDQQDKDFG